MGIDDELGNKFNQTQWRSGWGVGREVQRIVAACAWENRNADQNPNWSQSPQFPSLFLWIQSDSLSLSLSSSLNRPDFLFNRAVRCVAPTDSIRDFHHYFLFLCVWDAEGVEKEEEGDSLIETSEIGHQVFISLAPFSVFIVRSVIFLCAGFIIIIIFFSYFFLEIPRIMLVFGW